MWTRPTPTGAFKHVFNPKKAVIGCKKGGFLPRARFEGRLMTSCCVVSIGDRRCGGCQKRQFYINSKSEIELELELELAQSYMTQKPMPWSEVDARALRV